MTIQKTNINSCALVEIDEVVEVAQFLKKSVDFPTFSLAEKGDFYRKITHYENHNAWFKPCVIEQIKARIFHHLDALVLEEAIRQGEFDLAIACLKSGVRLPSTLFVECLKEGLKKSGGESFLLESQNFDFVLNEQLIPHFPHQQYI